MEQGRSTREGIEFHYATRGYTYCIYVPATAPTSYTYVLEFIDHATYVHALRTYGWVRGRVHSHYLRQSCAESSTFLTLYDLTASGPSRAIITTFGGGGRGQGG